MNASDVLAQLRAASMPARLSFDALVLDVSESMEANDLKPTRILAAKQVIRDFIRRRNHDRIGLVVFGGEAVTKSPLTRDYDFLLDQVEEIRLRELKQGTAIGMGLAVASVALADRSPAFVRRQRAASRDRFSGCTTSIRTSRTSRTSCRRRRRRSHATTPKCAPSIARSPVSSTGLPPGRGRRCSSSPPITARSSASTGAATTAPRSTKSR